MLERENETVETAAQEPDMSELWDGEEEDMAGGAADQRSGEPGAEDGQTSTDTAAEGRSEEVQPGGPQQPAEPPEGAPGQAAETFTLRHMDDPPVTVGREGVIRLAQQGLDYERVRTERDQLRQYRAQAGPALELVRAFAQKSGMTPEEYVDYCRAQSLMAQGVNEATAKAQVEMEKRQAALDAQTREDQAARQRQQVQQARQQAKAEAQKRDMMAFLDAYPEVKAADIPQEVWQKVAAGESLVNAYTMYQNRQLRSQIAAGEQNRQNAAKAPGSLGSRGEKGRKTLSDYWDEAQD